MAPNADPWRTLGLSPGATQDEIRRAYRRLAKINHPDAGGDAALPRFLAIQAAYEQLAGPGRTRRVGARPASRPTDGAPADAREPWRADPGRARASGRADGRRTPGARPTGPGTRARPTGGGSAEPRSGAPGGGGGPGASGGSGAPGGSRTGGAPRDAGTGAGGGMGAAGPSGRSGGPSTDPASGAHRSRRSTRRRPATTATPGSTSYEGADQEPFEPGWTGATWYGASSGTYWTINPKEYADPRKHGPEYQARARRAREGWILDEPDPTDPTSGAAQEPPGPEEALRQAETRTPPSAGSGRDAQGPAANEPAANGAAAEPAAARPAAAAGPAAADPAPRGADDDTPQRPSAAGRAARPVRATRARPKAQPAPSATWSAEADEATDGDGASHAGPIPGDPGRPDSGSGASGPPGERLRSWIEQPPDGAGFRGPLLRRPTTPAGRLAMALLGWPPLGVFAAAAIDETTGCGRLAASCPEVFAPGTWVVQAAILLLLLAVPVVAAWSAHGAIAALIVGVPSAVILSAAGGSNVRDQSGPLLLAVLAIAYLGGVAYAVLVARGRSTPA